MYEYDIKKGGHGRPYPIDDAQDSHLYGQDGDPSYPYATENASLFTPGNAASHGQGGSGLGFVIAVLGGLGGLSLAALTYSVGAGMLMSLLVHLTATPLLALLVGLIIVYRPRRLLARIGTAPRAVRPQYRTATYRGPAQRLRQPSSAHEGG